MPRPLTEHPLVRYGIMAWALAGLVVILVLAALIVAELHLVVAPLVIALFPAALLVPIANWVRRRGLPDAAAALVVTLGFLVGLAGVLGGLGWLIANELTAVVDTVEQSYDDIRESVEDTVGTTLPPIDELGATVREWAGGQDGIGARATSAAMATLEMGAAVLFGIVALFFYLKDGRRISGWLRDLFPRGVRADVEEIGRRVWYTLAAYFRGQLVVAAADAVFIGIGLFVLGVPLALPLSVLVFFGGLFPIVGAFTAGAVAALVALADGGLALALMVVAVNVVVQQVEGNVLEPLIVGRATQLHPLAVLVALTAGGLWLGILGAFLAVPVAASAARVVGYLRDDVRDPVADEIDDGAPAARDTG